MGKNIPHARCPAMWLSKISTGEYYATPGAFSAPIPNHALNDKFDSRDYHINLIPVVLN